MANWNIIVMGAGLGVLSLACSGASSGPQRSSGSGGGGNATSAGGAGGNGGTAGTATAGGTGGFDAGTGAVGGTSAGMPGVGGTGAMPGVGGTGPSVTFDWPESQPGLTCKPGHYLGTFAGAWAPSLIVFPAPIPVTGNVDLWLAESQSGEFLDIKDGKVSGVANGTFPYSADIEGRLNCKTLKIENGFLRNGLYTVPALPPVPWEGPLGADYDKLAGAFVNGTWKGTEMANALYGGNGTWTAGWVP